MKKTALILVLVFMFVFTGCTGETFNTEQEEKFFKKLPDQYVYSSSVGEWGTQLLIADNGTFSGKYFDMDKNNKDKKYPDGTAYICNFSGQFGDVKKINKYTYTMKVKRFDVEKIQGDEYTEGGIRYIDAKPYGMENADVLKVYFPGKSTLHFEKEYFKWDRKAKGSEKLPHFSIYNSTDEAVFVQIEE